MENNTCSLLNFPNIGYSPFMRMMMFFILLVIMSCGRESPTQKSEKISNAINSKQVNSLLEKKKFELKIYFEPNAKPEFGNFHDSSLAYWNLAQTNIERLLLNHYKTPNIFISQYIRTLPACFFNHKWYFFQETDRTAKRLPGILEHSSRIFWNWPLFSP